MTAAAVKRKRMLYRTENDELARGEISRKWGIERSKGPIIKKSVRRERRGGKKRGYADSQVLENVWRKRKEMLG